MKAYVLADWRAARGLACAGGAAPGVEDVAEGAEDHADWSTSGWADWAGKEITNVVYASFKCYFSRLQYGRK